MAKKDCTGVKALYQSLVHCQGAPVLPGIRGKVYAVPVKQIATWPTLPAYATTDMKEIVTYTGNFTLEAEAKWQSIDLTLNKGSITWESQGEEPGQLILNKAVLTHPEIDEDAAAFASQANRDHLVYVVQQRDGKWRVLGSEAFGGCRTTISGGTGEGVTSTDVGTVLNVEADDAVVAPFYVGTLDTEDGEINCGPADEGDEEELP